MLPLQGTSAVLLLLLLLLVLLPLLLQVVYAHCHPARYIAYGCKCEPITHVEGLRTREAAKLCPDLYLPKTLATVPSSSSKQEDITS